MHLSTRTRLGPYEIGLIHERVKEFLDFHIRRVFKPGKECQGVNVVVGLVGDNFEASQRDRPSFSVAGLFHPR